MTLSFARPMTTLCSSLIAASDGVIQGVALALALAVLSGLLIYFRIIP